MRPLQSIAMGLVVIALTARVAGYDVLPDPVGWLLVVLGARRLPRSRSVVIVAVLALAVSVGLWFPDVSHRLAGAHPALRWALDLPQLGFAVVACGLLAGLARAAGDRTAVAWLRTGLVLTVLAALAPIVAFAAQAGQAALATMYAAAAGVLLLLIVLFFGYSGRDWASATTAEG